jgi:hypothetical protein
MRSKTGVMVIGAACMLAACQGCSIYLAHDGHPGANLDSLGVGTLTQDVESQFGHPATVEPLGAGKRRAVYRVEATKQPNNLRALTHFILDYATLGIWELPATIYELRREHRLGEVGFVYGPDDRILEIEDYQTLQARTVSASESQTQTSSWQGLWDAISR